MTYTIGQTVEVRTGRNPMHTSWDSAVVVGLGNGGWRCRQMRTGIVAAYRAADIRERQA